MFYLQEKIETIKEEEMERRRREKDKKKTGEVTVQIKGIPQTPQPEGKVKDVPIYKVRIPLIQIKDTLQSEVLFPPQLRLHTGLRLVLIKPMIAQVPDAEMTRPPMLSSEHCFKLLLPSPLESSLKDSHLYHPPLIKYSPSVIPRRQMLQLIESVSVTSNVLQPLVFNRDVMPKEIPRRLEKKLEKKIEESKGVSESADIGLCDLIFESIDKDHSLESILGASSERPVVILAEKSDNDYIDALKLILREIYRIKVGGLPEAKVIVKEGREVEQTRPEDCIVVIDDKKDELFKFLLSKKSGVEKSIMIKDGRVTQKTAQTGIPKDEMKKLDMDKLLDERLSELYAQKFGFLVFYVTKEIFDVLSQRIDPYEYKVKIIPIKLRKLSIEETKNISSMVWGFLKYEGLENLSEYFGKYEKMFYEKLEKLSTIMLAGDVKESAEDEENGKESDLHYLIKLFLVKYLREVEKIENLETETQIDGVIPDIYVPDKHLAIEVETLYGTGVKYLRKLGKTVEKYKDKRYELWLVLPNLQLLLFYKQILEVKNKFKDKVQIKFWTLDLKNGRLVPLEEMLERQIVVMN